MLNWIKKRYGNPPIYLLENGYQGHPEDGLEDHERAEYHRSYINEMLKAVRIDGVNVQMYGAWTLLDSFEWEDGYSVNFGVVAVNFSDPERKRTPKLSGAFLKKVFMNNGFPRCKWPCLQSKI
ncbi:cytosolic beta-glucosidase-like [Folsomia candida]|uniref:cytosolic beta-glucosidase-like n=1 Tax=Folsomia candida TaxID=158441 RepID=UPI0016050A60|nr:cytosolic beta-glucosidase-like [Folsomia candida]